MAAAAFAAALAGCVSAPARYSEVVVMKPGEAPRQTAPPAGTVWRLEESALKALSPAPIVEPPPPPARPPPPRPNDPPPAPSPYYGPYWHWGPYFYFWRGW